MNYMFFVATFIILNFTVTDGWSSRPRQYYYFRQLEQYLVRYYLMNLRLN